MLSVNHNLIMAMWTCRISSASNLSYILSSCNKLASRYIQNRIMCIKGTISVTMINYYIISICNIIFCFYNSTILTCKNIRPIRCGNIYTCMNLLDLKNRMHSSAILTCDCCISGCWPCKCSTIKRSRCCAAA